MPLEENHGDAFRLSFDPRSEFLACADESEIIVWSTKNRTKDLAIKLPLGYTVRELAVSPGGRYIATPSTNGEARLWDARNNTRVSLSSDDEQSVSFSRDGKWLSIGSESEIKLWNLDAKKFDHRPIPVAGFMMTFSPDSSILATREGKDGKISVWNLNVRDPLLEGTTIADLYPDYGFAFASDNHLLTEGDPGVFVENFDASWALGHVCNIVKRNLTSTERDKYLPRGFDYKPTCPPSE